MRWAAALLLAAAPAVAADLAPPDWPPPGAPAFAGEGIELVCPLIAWSAREHGLPPEFLARLLWKESLFNRNAISPKGAQGIAQFMPGTAKLEGLADPFDPVQAIPASARLLAKHRAEFGNLGLAAVAYNGGPGRAARFKAKGGWLPMETLNYVQSITYRPAEWFREEGRELERRPLEKGLPFMEACLRLPEREGRELLDRPKYWPWGVQVAAGPTRRSADQIWRRVSGHVRRVTSAEHRMHRQRTGGPKWQVRLGVGSRSAGARLCNRLRRARVFCVVRRN